MRASAPPSPIRNLLSPSFQVFCNHLGVPAGRWRLGTSLGKSQSAECLLAQAGTPGDVIPGLRRTPKAAAVPGRGFPLRWYGRHTGFSSVAAPDSAAQEQWPWVHRLRSDARLSPRLPSQMEPLSFARSHWTTTGHASGISAPHKPGGSVCAPAAARPPSQTRTLCGRTHGEIREATGLAHRPRSQRWHTRGAPRAVASAEGNGTPRRPPSRPSAGEAESAAVAAGSARSSSGATGPGLGKRGTVRDLSAGGAHMAAPRQGESAEGVASPGAQRQQRQRGTTPGLHAERIQAMLDSLNEEQRVAATSSERVTRVIAGPGSGKTRVLTARVAHLIRNCGVPPSQIMCVTFTNRAAVEVEERLQHLLEGVPGGIRGLTVGTFHSICARLIRSHVGRLPCAGLSKGFTILDSDDCKKLITKIVKGEGQGGKKGPGEVQVSAARNVIAQTQDTWLRLLLRWWRESEDNLALQGHGSPWPVTGTSQPQSQRHKGRPGKTKSLVHPQSTAPPETGLEESLSHLSISPPPGPGSPEFWARLRDTVEAGRRGNGRGSASSEFRAMRMAETGWVETGRARDGQGGARSREWNERALGTGQGMGTPGPAGSPAALERLMQVARSPAHQLSPPHTVTVAGDASETQASHVLNGGGGEKGRPQEDWRTEEGAKAKAGEGGFVRQPQSVGEALLLSLLGHLGQKEADPEWGWVFEQGWRSLVYEGEGAGAGQGSALWAPRDPMDPKVALASKAPARDVYAPFQRAKRTSNAVDFDDLLVLAVLLLRASPDVWSCPSLELQHVLVDEFQDTDAAQYEFIRLLMSRGTPKSLFVVGDMDQAIYGFRGADPSFLQDAFDRDFPDCRTLQLRTNYRSSASILEAAARLISSSKGSRSVGGLKPLRMAPTRARGPTVQVVSAVSCRDEAAFVRRKIQSLLKGEPPQAVAAGEEVGQERKGAGGSNAPDATGFRPRDIAVLYRAKSLMGTVERELLANGIPYVVLGKLSLAERKDPKTLLAYLRLLANPLDSLALARVINEPPRGVGPTALKTLEDWAQGRGQSLAQALHETGAQLPAKEELPLKAPARKGVQSLCAILRSAREAVPHTHPGELLMRISREIDFEGHISKEPRAKGSAGPQAGEEEAGPDLEEGSSEAEKKRKQEERKQVLADFMESAYSLAKDLGPGPEGLQRFLDQLALVADGEEDVEDAKGKRARRRALDRDAVRLMTVHASKGLEFGAVFLVGCEEGILPSWLSKAPKEVDEELRVCYVAVTRAQHRLFLCHARSRFLYGKHTTPEPSRFLRYLKQGA